MNKFSKMSNIELINIYLGNLPECDFEAWNKVYMSRSFTKADVKVLKEMGLI